MTHAKLWTDMFVLTLPILRTVPACVIIIAVNDDNVNQSGESDSSGFVATCRFLSVSANSAKF
jgi:hypothetical protein